MNFMPMQLPTAAIFVSRRRGFTLVEMFIVGALIALFAGIAVINIQQQFDSNKRKAMIGEARQLGSSIAFAKLDTGVFPRLCFLSLSDTQLQFEARQRGYVGAEKYFYSIMDYLGRNTFAIAPNLDSNWRGPYFSASQSRGGTAQGRGGFVNMAIPEVPTSTTDPFRWPADGYGNPWVVYLVSADLSQNPPAPYFLNAQNVNSPTTNPDFFTAVVSYGPNRIPGGGPAADLVTQPVAAQNRIYVETGFNQYRMLTANEYTPARARFVSNRFGTTGLAPNDQGIATGIIDAGSDDIIYEF